MDGLNLLCLPPDKLRALVMDRLRAHWTPARPGEPLAGHQREGALGVSRAVLDTMLTRQFRVGRLPAQRVYNHLLERVHRRVGRGQPIAVTVGYGPLKNQNAVAYSRADWAEFFSLCHLIAWHNKVQAIYSPGLSIGIAFDDTTLAMANHADKRLMHSYQLSIAGLIQALGFQGIVRATMRHSHFAWLFHLGPYQIAAWRVRRWERDPVNRVQLERMDHFARRNLLLPENLTPVEHDAYVRGASHRYRIYWEALQLSGLTRSKNRLIAMYLDGSQHHVRQEVAFHLTSLEKGCVTQPWQGAGALEDNAHGALTPLVLTANRQRRYTTRIVPCLNLLNCPGFDTIAVAQLEKSSEGGPETAPASVGVSCRNLA
jgi:hypothetical protein